MTDLKSTAYSSTGWLVALLLLLCCITPSSAQTGKKKQAEEKVPVYNYVIDEPMDQFARRPQVYRIAVLPEFVILSSYYIGDTLISFECFDRLNQKLSKDTITNPASIYYVSAIKKYSDPKHTYKDNDGTEKPIPTEKIFLRYDRLGTNRWLFADYAKFAPVTMQEYPDDIARTDTITVLDPVKNEDVNIVYKRYKVTPLSR